MQSEPRQVHISRRRRCVEPRQNIEKLFGVFHADATVVIFLEESFESLVSEGPDHALS